MSFSWYGWIGLVGSPICLSRTGWFRNPWKVLHQSSQTCFKVVKRHCFKLGKTMELVQPMSVAKNAQPNFCCSAWGFCSSLGTHFLPLLVRWTRPNHLRATMHLAPFGLRRKTRSMNPEIENYMYTCLHNQMFGWMSSLDRM